LFFCRFIFGIQFLLLLLAVGQFFQVWPFLANLGKFLIQTGDFITTAVVVDRSVFTGDCDYGENVAHTRVNVNRDCICCFIVLCCFIFGRHFCCDRWLLDNLSSRGDRISAQLWHLAISVKSGKIFDPNWQC